MSYLIAIPASADRANLAKNIQRVFWQDRYTEIGLAWTYKGAFQRNVTIKSIKSVSEYIHGLPFEGAIIYANNPDRAFDPIGNSPIIIPNSCAFAACGNMLELTTFHDGKSNAQVFAEQVLLPCCSSAPGITSMSQFAWMMGIIARKYVGVAFLHPEGDISLIHSHLFSKDQSGFFYMNFERAKSQHIAKQAAKQAAKAFVKMS